VKILARLAVLAFVASLPTAALAQQIYADTVLRGGKILTVD